MSTTADARQPSGVALALACGWYVYRFEEQVIGFVVVGALLPEFGRLQNVVPQTPEVLHRIERHNFLALRRVRLRTQIADRHESSGEYIARHSRRWRGGSGSEPSRTFELVLPFLLTSYLQPTQAMHNQASERVTA